MRRMCVDTVDPMRMWRYIRFRLFIYVQLTTPYSLASLQSDDESRLSIPSRPDTPTARFSQVYQHDIQHDARVAHLMKENLALEKVNKQQLIRLRTELKHSSFQRLNTALLHTEVAESSNKTVTKELEEAKETISRLNLSQAKSTGWETRLGMALQDSEDLRQELDTERQRGKMVHAQLIAMKERCREFACSYTLELHNTNCI